MAGPPWAHTQVRPYMGWPWPVAGPPWAHTQVRPYADCHSPWRGPPGRTRRCAPTVLVCLGNIFTAFYSAGTRGPPRGRSTTVMQPGVMHDEVVLPVSVVPEVEVPVVVVPEFPMRLTRAWA